MRHIWNTWLRYVVLGLTIVGLLIGFPGCGACDEEGNVNQALYHDTLAPGTTIHVSSTAHQEGSAPSEDTLPPLPAVSDSPNADMMTNWRYFFYGPTPLSTKTQLLENGQQHVGELTEFAAFTPSMRAQVAGASWTSEDETAGQVTYDLYLDGSAVFTGRTGTMVLQDGVWKVSEQSFQEFLAEVRSGLAPSTTTP